MLEAFWSQCSQNGTPIIEDVPNHDDYKLVTFVWKAKEQHQNVCVLLDQFAFNLERATMQHIANTDYLVFDDAHLG